MALDCAIPVPLISCQEQAWYEHYEDSGKAGSEKTMMEYIKSEPQLGLFLQMLEVSGYDTLLSVSQTFTVWAPQNNALSGIDLDDTTTVTEIISNHIARYCIGTSSTRSDKVFMLSNKLVSFEGNKFGLTNLVSSNIKVANGLLHIIDGFVPYVPNIWEYTGRIPGLDSLAAYFLSQNQREFNLLESKQIGVNADNQPIYDSSFIESNRYLTERVNLNNEDAVFTALFPNNQAWHKSFDLIKDYYKTTDADGGWTKQKSLAQAALVKDLVYLDNFKEKGIPDSLVTSSGHVIDSAKVLFQGAVSHDASNGVIYVTDSLRIPATSSWHIPFQIEAEDNYYGRTSLNAKLYNRTSAGTSVARAQVSGSGGHRHNHLVENLCGFSHTGRFVGKIRYILPVCARKRCESHQSETQCGQFVYVVFRARRKVEKQCFDKEKCDNRCRRYHPCTCDTDGFPLLQRTGSQFRNKRFNC